MKIKKGCTRTVFVFKKYVVKIPTFVQYDLFLKGLLANLQERRWSGKHNDLAKVICSSRFGLWLVMQRASVVNSNVNWSEFNSQISDKYKDDNLKEFMLSDLKPSNWGYMQGKLVKIDYGD